VTTGVLIMAYGTPASPEEIEAFYTRIRHGRAPSDEQLADLTRRYRAIGGTSPLTPRTLDQVNGVRSRLDELAPGHFLVAYGAKYAAPLIEEAASDLLARGVSRVIGLVLAPHESSLSTAQYMDRARSALGEGVELAAIGAWWSNDEFIAIMAERVRAALAEVPEARRTSTVVVFSAHSLPRRIVAAGETYPEQLAESARLVAEALGLDRYVTAWQSAGRTEEEWLGPDILAVLGDLRASGASDVVVCPIGFVSDHLEVLYDIDVEATALADSIGLALTRTASLNDDPAFIDMLSHLVLEHE